MASNLLKKHEVMLFDQNESVIQYLVSSNSSKAHKSHPDEMVKYCQSIVTMLPSSPNIREVYVDSTEALIHSLKISSNKPLLLDCSTIDPLTARELSLQMHQIGVSALDCPVSGGVGGASDATLTFMVGSNDESDYENAKSILLCMGKKVIHTGKSGTGQTAKICNNLALAIEMSAVSEAFNLGRKLGIDLKVLSDIFNSASARCWSTEVYSPVTGLMPNVPSSNNYRGGFQSRLMQKDLHLALGAAKEIEMKLSFGELTSNLYQKLILDKGKGELDFSYIYQAMQEQNPNK